MLRVAICDDERLHRQHTAELTEQALEGSGADISCFDGAESLLRTMDEGYTPDIAILDIEMGEDKMDDISLAEQLNALAPACRIIFVTSYLAFAMDVYRTDHVYFIVKNQLEQRIAEALGKAVAALDADMSSEMMLAIKSRGSTELIPVKDVKYIERLGRKAHTVTVGAEYWSAHTPAELLRGHEEQFIRCHQSIWVNPQWISALKSDEFQLSDGSSVPISRSYKQTAREQFFASLRRQQSDIDI